MEPQERFVTTAYCVMALPLVVAITQIVVDAGAMTSQDASVLVTAGAVTVLVVPVLTSLVRVAVPHPVHALSSIVSGEESANEALERQRRAVQNSRRRFEAARARRRRELGRTLSSAEFIAQRGGDEPSDESSRRDAH